MIRSHVLVCGGTGCASAGGTEILEEFRKQIIENGLSNEIAVVQTGCHGLCAMGPIVVVYPEATFYAQVTPADVAEIVSEHLLKGRVVSRLVYKEESGSGGVSLNDTEFFRRQHRVALRNCGVIDPENIDEYIGTGGYEALGKVLTEMTPEEVIE